MITFVPRSERNAKSRPLRSGRTMSGSSGPARAWPPDSGPSAQMPGASVLDRDGLVAAVVPSCPDLSVVNSVVYDDAEALRKARDELEAAYERAGVRAWRVWVPERDRSVAQALAQAGHRLTVAPRA